MKIDAMVSGANLREVQRLAPLFEQAGFDGIWFTEGGRTAYLSCAAAALATETITIGTAIAVAFPRSPMVTAQAAWELADATDGRFVLGLGTQVRAHIERRYSSAYERPGPRLRDYIQAVRAIWRAFQGDEKLDYRGEFYNFTMLGDTWTGGAIDDPGIPIYAAAVRPWMLRMCGEVADGVHVHPFHSRRYLDDVVRVSVDEGARQAGRPADSITLAVPVMSIVGDDRDELDRWRERARMQIAFYGSTRTYRGVFEVHGWHGTAERLYESQRAGDVAAMRAAVTDEMLGVYAVESTWGELADVVIDRYHGAADRVVMYFAGTSVRADPKIIDRWASVTDVFHSRVQRMSPL
jgi:probable F420-dependent oxidoreductase